MGKRFVTPKSQSRLIGVADEFLLESPDVRSTQPGGFILHPDSGDRQMSIRRSLGNDALQVASKKVSASKRQSLMMNNGVVLNGEMDLGNGSQEMAYQSRGEKEKKIRELSAELEDTNKKCEAYRANLLAVLKDMEEQKLKLSVKVQNARLSLKE
ncbi:unnamed protein product [Lactuca saligna]|uniref:Uncharacterized protein n=1 Tax=Lactuca saligna TaxID=75948 RepID=A0AA36EKB8_LACSI|nr:unnamed protein product [Lactuca saligna]